MTNYLGYRYQGGVTDWVFARDGGTFNNEEKSSHIADLALRLECDESEIEAFEVEGFDPYPSATVFVPADPEPAPPPDPNGFLLAALGALGLVPGNSLLAKWPTFTVALNARNWTVARAVLDAAKQTGDLTGQQHDTLAQLLTDHGIPEA